MIVSVCKIESQLTKPVLPTKGTAYSAGYDLYSAVYTTTICPGETVKIDTGLIFEIPNGYFGQILPRSGLSSKGLICITGTIDSDYRGTVSVLLLNTSKQIIDVTQGQRIAQIVFKKFEGVTFKVILPHEISFTDRGTGGFGSTGI